MRVLALLSSNTCGAFRGADAMAAGVTRRQLVDLARSDVVERVLPDVYRLTAVPRSRMQRLHAALLWAGDQSSADGRSAGSVYGREGVHADRPEVVVPRDVMRRHPNVVVSRTERIEALMVRTHKGVRVAG